MPATLDPYSSFILITRVVIGNIFINLASVMGRGPSLPEIFAVSSNSVMHLDTVVNVMYRQQKRLMAPPSVLINHDFSRTRLVQLHSIIIRPRVKSVNKIGV